MPIPDLPLLPRFEIAVDGMTYCKPTPAKLMHRCGDSSLFCLLFEAFADPTFGSVPVNVIIESAFAQVKVSSA